MRRPAHGPRIVVGIVEHGCAGADEQMGHLLLVDVFDHRHVGGGADRIDQEQHLLAFDQAADLLDRFWRAVGVVEADVIDLAAVDAALIVDHREVGGGGDRAGGIGRRRSAIGRGGADLDFGVGDARPVTLLRQRRRQPRGEHQRRAGGKLRTISESHQVSLPLSIAKLGPFDSGLAGTGSYCCFDALSRKYAVALPRLEERYIRTLRLSFSTRSARPLCRRAIRRSISGRRPSVVPASASA